ncbi:MAG: carbamoyl-phosphate synthase domain-containing protein, partial [Pseudomonadales bacterium]
MSSALLALENGLVFKGKAIGIPGRAVGEVVFNTAITGYQEILTDPSYAKQIVTLTHPHIGNTGVNAEDEESGAIHAAGLVIRDLPFHASNWRQQESLADYLQRHQLVAIAEIDTRKLTSLLRDEGAQNGCILAAEKITDKDIEEAIAAAKNFPGLKGMDLAQEVTAPSSYEWRQGGWQLGNGYAAP